MSIILAILLSVVWVVIAAFHFYWGFGGQLFADRTFPTTETDGQYPQKGLTFFVAFVFLAFAGISLMYAFPDHLLFSGSLRDNLALGIAGVCILRGIGDFKYAGVTKKRRGTLFAKWDDRLYTPISFVLGILTVLMAMEF